MYALILQTDATYAPDKNCRNVVVTVEADSTATRVIILSWSWKKFSNLSNIELEWLLIEYSVLKKCT